MAHIDFNFTTAPQHLLDIINANKDAIIDIFRTTPDGILDVFKGNIVIFPDFADYAAQYFETAPFLENAMGYIEEKGYKPPHFDEEGQQVRMRTINRMADDPLTSHFNTDGTRNSQSYILGREDLAQAKAYIAENPSFHVGIAALQGCLTSYLDDLIGNLRGYAGMHNDADLKYILARIDGEFTKNADADSFLRDMSPLIARSLSYKSTAFSPEDLKDPGVLRSFFEKHAFKSSAYFPGNIPDTRKCPFAPHFAEVMSIHISSGQDGLYKAERGQFGDTLLSVMERINLTPQQKVSVVDSMHL